MQQLSRTVEFGGDVGVTKRRAATIVSGSAVVSTYMPPTEHHAALVLAIAARPGSSLAWFGG